MVEVNKIFLHLKNFTCTSTVEYKIYIPKDSKILVSGYGGYDDYNGYNDGYGFGSDRFGRGRYS